MNAYEIETREANDFREDKNDAYGYRTLAYVTFIDFHRRWYHENGDRKIPEDIHIDESLLRGWIFADGTKSSGGVVLCSERFTKSDQEKLIIKMNKSLKIHAYTVRHVKKTRIRIPAKDRAKIASMCQPIIPDMKHKFEG